MTISKVKYIQFSKKVFGCRKILINPTNENQFILLKIIII